MEENKCYFEMKKKLLERQKILLYFTNSDDGDKQNSKQNTDKKKKRKLLTNTFDQNHVIIDYFTCQSGCTYLSTCFTASLYRLPNYTYHNYLMNPESTLYRVTIQMTINRKCFLFFFSLHFKSYVFICLFSFLLLPNKTF